MLMMAPVKKSVPCHPHAANLFNVVQAMKDRMDPRKEKNSKGTQFMKLNILLQWNVPGDRTIEKLCDDVGRLGVAGGIDAGIVQLAQDHLDHWQHAPADLAQGP